MSISLANITAEVKRKAAYNAAIAAASNTTTQMAASQEAVQQHFCRAIKDWAAQEGSSSANAKDFRLRESQISADVLTTWERELREAGYIVTRVDGYFIVSISDTI